MSVRTIYRDIEALSGAGVPIYAESGPGGGVRLVDGYRTRLTGLTAEEAEALALSGLPGAASELGLGTVLAAAQLKVDAALPPELRSRAVRMRERFHLDAPGWFAREEPVPHLAALSRAVWEERRLEIRYRKWDGEVRRVVDPLGLVLKAGVWYLVALSGRTRSIRTFRVSRVRRACRSSTRTLCAPTTSTWPRTGPRRARRSSRRWSRVDVARPHAARRTPVAPPRPRPRGAPARPSRQPASPTATAGSRPPSAWSTSTTPRTSCCRFGDDLEVLDPPELRERMAATAAAAMAARVRHRVSSLRHGRRRHDRVRRLRQHLPPAPVRAAGARVGGRRRGPLPLHGLPRRVVPRGDRGRPRRTTPSIRPWTSMPSSGECSGASSRRSGPSRRPTR